MLVKTNFKWLMKILFFHTSNIIHKAELYQYSENIYLHLKKNRYNFVENQNNITYELFRTIKATLFSKKLFF